MNKIKISELFYSIQGEGRYMGVPSIFLRTFGCNFQCSGFGMTAGNESTERLNINPADYNSYHELPLVTTGCDSYASWDVRFKHLSPMLTVDEIANKIQELLPFNEWQSEHLVITGGEPLLGWQRSYPALLEHTFMQQLSELTFETNGTQDLSSDLESYLVRWQMHPTKEVTFSVSPKLSCSGEDSKEAIRPDIICQYEDVGYTYLKFVVATEDDVKEALDVISLYRNEGFFGPVYLMPVGGVESVYTLNNRKVAELALKYGLRYSDRLQVPLFHNNWGA